MAALSEAVRQLDCARRMPVPQRTVEDAMPYYLVQAAYTPEAWAAQLKNPQNRSDAVRTILDRIGGRLESLYYAFGEHDVVVTVEVPNNVSAAAVSLAVTASGAFRSFKTTPLMTIEEGLEAMRKGAEVAAIYRPPTAATASV
jgi:uncharacterized protein with GYD domain